VKIKIRLNEGIRIVPCAVHHTDRFSQGSKVLIVSTSRRQCSDLGFQNFANFHQVGRSIWSTALENPVERLAHGIRIAIRDERPPSGKGVHESLFVERLDRLTNGRSADTKLLRELALCRKLISLLQSTFEDGFLYLLNNCS